MSDDDAVVTPGVEATKYDPVVDDLPINVDSDQTIQLLYELDSSAEVAQVKRIRDEQVYLEYPVDTVDVFENLRFIERQFAVANNSVVSDKPSVVNRAALQAIPFAADAEDINLPDNNVERRRLEIAVLSDVRAASYDTLQDQLSGELQSQFDWIKIPSESTVSRVRNGDGFISGESLDALTTRVRHALFRNGFHSTITDLPYEDDTVATDTDAAYPRDTDIPSRLRCQAIINWCDWLLEAILQDVSFNRGANASFSVRTIIASYALGALHSSLSEGIQIGELQYRSSLPSSRRLTQIIDNIVTVPEDDEEEERQKAQQVLGLSQTLHLNFLELADEVQYFSSDVRGAVDDTWTPVEDRERNEPLTVDNLYEPGETNSLYPVVMGFSQAAYVSLGLGLVEDKTHRNQEYEGRLLNLNLYGSFGWLLADREKTEGSVIDLFRSNAENWIIRAKRTTNVKRFIKTLSDGQSDKGSITIKGRKVSIFAYWDADTNAHKYYISDASTDEYTPSDIHDIYSQRWAIESFIRQVKHDLNPENKTSSSVFDLFAFNLASIFYNIWKLIDHTLSPEFGVPLDVRYYEVLWCIAAATFDSRPTFQPQTTGER